MQITVNEISRIIHDNRRSIGAFGVKKLGLFGSTARGDNSETSDIDFLVEFADGGKSFDHFMELSFLLEDLLQRKIDLATPESLPAAMRDRVSREVLYIEV